MAGKKPDFSIEPVEQVDAPPPLDYETAFGTLNLPEQFKALVLGTTLRFTMTGLVINTELSQPDWLTLLDSIRAIKRAYQWIIGDWMLYGFEREWSNTYDAMAELTGLKAKTVKEYTYICRNIPASIRMDKLSFAHFQLIAPIQADHRTAWIDKAVVDKLSVRDLRDAIQEHYKLPAGAEAPALLDKVNKRRIDKVWRNLSRGSTEKIKRDDLRLIRAWLDEVEKELKK
jgi:hypothetical protein